MFILNNYCYFLGSIGGLLVLTLQKLHTQIPIHGFIQPEDIQQKDKQRSSKGKKNPQKSVQNIDYISACVLIG
jgi:hypothetical protein